MLLCLLHELALHSLHLLVCVRSRGGGEEASSQAAARAGLVRDAVAAGELLSTIGHFGAAAAQLDQVSCPPSPQPTRLLTQQHPVCSTHRRWNWTNRTVLLCLLEGVPLLCKHCTQQPHPLCLMHPGGAAGAPPHPPCVLLLKCEQCEPSKSAGSVGCPGWRPTVSHRLVCVPYMCACPFSRHGPVQVSLVSMRTKTSGELLSHHYKAHPPSLHKLWALVPELGPELGLERAPQRVLHSWPFQAPMLALSVGQRVACKCMYPLLRQ